MPEDKPKKITPYARLLDKHTKLQREHADLATNFRTLEVSHETSYDSERNLLRRVSIMGAIISKQQTLIGHPSSTLVPFSLGVNE